MDYIKEYANFLRKFLKPIRQVRGKPKRKLKVIFDCSNGTTGIIIKNLVSSIQNLEAILINDRPDGNFPAHGPNPLAPGAADQLKKEVLKQKADLGVIFDADGDRVFFADNRGRWVDPNEIAYILMQLFKPPYVIGIVSSRRLKKLSGAKSASGGRKVFISRVGHYFFKKLMREKKASLGLEHSGHYYFQNFFYCDSGILAAIEVINFVSGLKTDLAGWLDGLPPYYRSGEINFEVRDKEKVLKAIEKKYKNSAGKIFKLDGLTLEFNWAWLNIRASNTEPLLRLNIEATSKKLLNEKLKEIKKLLVVSRKL